MSFFRKLGEAAGIVGTALGIAFLAGSPIGFPLLIAAAVLGVTSGVAGYLDAKDQAKNLQQKTEGIKANKIIAGGRIPVIYGSRRVGAQIVYMETRNNENKDLFVVYALGVGELENINRNSIRIDGDLITNSERFKDGYYIGSDKISSGAGSLNTAAQSGNITSVSGEGTDPTGVYRMVFNLHHGAATQTVDPMLDASISKWTSNHKLNGIAYIAAKYHYDTEGMFRNVPQLTVTVQGKKVYDPRDSSQTFGNTSTYEWSNNPALTFLDYITNDEYGKGLSDSVINMTTFSAAANICDNTNNGPDFNGSESAVAWSGTSGLSSAFIDNFSDWKKFKVGEKIILKDNGGNTIVNNRIITEVYKYKFPFASSNKYVVVWDSQHPLTQNYDIDGTVANANTLIPKFHCNGVIDPDNNIIENAKELLACMRGIFVYVDGKFELHIENVGSSTFSITDDHIIGKEGMEISYGSKDARANKVVVEFVNGQNDFEPDTITALHNASPNFTSDDGGEELEITAQFPHVTDPYIAFNLAKGILTRSRNQMAVSFTGTIEMYKLNIGDIVDFTAAGFGLSGKVMRVAQLELQENGLVRVVLIEYFDVYSWTVPPQQSVNDVMDLPTIFAVKAPTNLAFTDTNSSSTGRPFISWDVPTDYPYYQYRVNIVDSSSNQLLNTIVDKHFSDLNFLPIGSNYVASITALNSTGTESNATTLTFSIADKPIKTNDLQDGSVTTPTIADSTGSSDGVTTAKIATDAITAAKIAANTITANEIAANTLTSTSGVFGAISADDITAGTLNASRIAANSLSISGIAISGTAGNIGVATGSKTNGTTTDNVISFYYGQGTSLTTFLSSSPFNNNGTYTLFQLANKSFTTPSFSGTKPYAFYCSGNPVGTVGGDEESIAVLEVKTSSGTIVSEQGFVRTGTQSLSPHLLGTTANLSGNTSYVVSIYVGIKNFDPNNSQLGFSQGYVQAIGLAV
ncbi:MAG: putative baseplate hub protein [Prokaryotic dsDNA virus sp.]|nr:MAG: putative baseplate hub protein [Prokaryotic dsDNA virus sp.]|tara:strand:+ start:17380 stop:20292 length:2913 start_codon:yes stop_codon:yes gene_type:complete